MACAPFSVGDRRGLPPHGVRLSSASMPTSMRPRSGSITVRARVRPMHPGQGYHSPSPRTSAKSAGPTSMARAPLLSAGSMRKPARPRQSRLRTGPSTAVRSRSTATRRSRFSMSRQDGICRRSSHERDGVGTNCRKPRGAAMSAALALLWASPPSAPWRWAACCRSAEVRSCAEPCKPLPSGIAAASGETSNASPPSPSRSRPTLRRALRPSHPSRRKQQPFAPQFALRWRIGDACAQYRGAQLEVGERLGRPRWRSHALTRSHHVLMR